MLFNSLQFLVFYPVVTLFYFLLPGLRTRNVLLLIASYYFYMQYRPEYAILMLLSTIVDYSAGLGMSRAKSKGRKKLWFVLSLCGNVGMLFFFKYFNFINQNIGGLLDFFNVSYQPLTLNVLLPVGISFYTFQSLSYTIEIYRGNLEAEKDFLTFALYVSFFPQLVAGPIERATHMLPQYHRFYPFDRSRAVSGLKLMVWGFFKKVVIADRLAVVVNTVYNNPKDHIGVEYIIATAAFALQIFCDFSGYSDIAIGSARLMGFDLMRNFERPYQSRSVTEFWRRWHISLSSWFRDYVFIPLGGSRKGYTRTLINLFLIFLLSGLWHGASWTFVIWGAANGVAIVIEKVLGVGKRSGKKQHADELIEAQRKRPFIIRFLLFFRDVFGNIYTNIFIGFTWVFFRAKNVEDAFYMLPRFFQRLDTFNLGKFLNSRTILGLDYLEFYTVLGAIVLMIAIHTLQRFKSPSELIRRMPATLRLVVYAASLSLVIWLAWTETQTFIYFAF